MFAKFIIGSSFLYTLHFTTKCWLMMYIIMYEIGKNTDTIGFGWALALVLFHNILINSKSTNK